MNPMTFETGLFQSTYFKMFYFRTLVMALLHLTPPISHDSGQVYQDKSGPWKMPKCSAAIIKIMNDI